MRRVTPIMPASWALISRWPNSACEPKGLGKFLMEKSHRKPAILLMMANSAMNTTMWAS